ncbi:MAG: protoporphyrin/coproporphyrin ferrochelatase [Acidobacteriota bacterium]|jgi:ferrochelatase|nr:protoporphyrin/coproporphyrin ferrochelatase [Acidobacteriota bacterium]
MNQSYDALLIVSFGGPEGMDEVMPFLENVLHGKNVPPERMRAVAHHYELFGGVSPINSQNRTLIAALEKELAANGPRLPIYWGNRNWHPVLADTLRQMADDGIKSALAFFTSAYSSYSGCRQYREDISRAQSELGSRAPQVEKLRAFYNHPGFIEPNIENVVNALSQIPAERRERAQIAFTAHSIPLSMAMNCDYEAQLQETCRLVAEGAGHECWRLVFQSRSGSPTQPWLEPDIRDYLIELKEAGTTDVVVAPVGFISDHLEVIYDLDTEARALSEKIGLNMIRAATVGAHPTFVKMIRELILERLNPDLPRRYLGVRGASQDVCPADCCLMSAGRPVGV